MGLPCEFTMPVPGAWQERQGSAAGRADGIVASPNIPNNPQSTTTLIRPAFAESFTAWRLGMAVREVKMGLFAGLDWGKMRIILKNLGPASDTPSVFQRLRRIYCSLSAAKFNNYRLVG